MADAVRPVPCPSCKRPSPAGTKHFPFCSDRCRLVDLGRWFHGDYTVSRPLRPGDLPPEGAPEEE